MYSWARPKIAIPVHGERRHLLEHADLARSLQVPRAIAARNGDMILLDAVNAGIIDETPAGRLHLDAEVLVSADADSLRERKRMAFGGALTVALAVDGGGKIVDGPDVRAIGFPDGTEKPLEVFLDAAADEVERTWSRMPKSERQDEEGAEETLSRVVRKLAQTAYDRRPVVEVMILRV
jgi:ribonuclease J